MLLLVCRTVYLNLETPFSPEFFFRKRPPPSVCFATHQRSVPQQRARALTLINMSMDVNKAKAAAAVKRLIASWRLKCHY
jgi:hypothetical protein